MKFFRSLCVFFLLLPFMAKGQNIDSIRLEQVGDLIKVHYKILNSNPNQVFRVSVLCSINGGLKSQLNNISGDFGENVTGGRDNYMILWDVLKDVDELKSAEFFIKAELVKDLSEKQDGAGLKPKTKAKFHFLLALEAPGPKGGLRIGYMGSYGLSVQLNYGKVPVTDVYVKNTYYEEFDPQAGIAIDLTKRIFTQKDFEMHLLAGYRQTDLVVYFAGGTTPQFWRHGMDGAGIGMIFEIKRIAACVTISHFNPKQVERKIDEPVEFASPYNMIDLGVGINF